MGLFLGIQFLLWTLGGLYFSWTQIDEIHGDHFLSEKKIPAYTFDSVTVDFFTEESIKSMQLVSVLNQPYFLINDHLLYHAVTGELRGGITESEAVTIASSHLKNSLPVSNITYLTEVGKHHEFRGRPLPTWKVDFQSKENLSVYINATDGSFQRIRHRSWRWFDFLWMFHTMDYEGRDDMNNTLLRAFSILGLITVASGFALFFATFRRR
ncbi:MAG: hypothetical protein AAFQ94_17560 [Bacteroidota bacterium]